MKAWKSVTAAILIVGATVLSASGCKDKDKLIEKVTFKLAEDLQTVRASLVFTSRIKANYSGTFSVKEYGHVFINPYTETQPFEAGLVLNTAIVNDQDFIRLTPTTVLPNGMPIGLPWAVVEVHNATPISDKFDLFAYVDVLHTSWLGVATMFSFINDDNFPIGLSVSQVFFRNEQGQPGAMASIFGPTVDADGNLVRNGGIALFANVRQLIDQIGDDGEVTFTAAETYLDGPAAPQMDMRKLLELQERLIDGFNSN